MKFSARSSLALPLLALAIAPLSYQLGRARADGIPTTTPLLYGGMLEESGSPVQGTRTFTIRLWDSAAGGSLACAETNAPNTPVQNGQWRVAVNPACISAVQQTPNLWVETLVDGTSLGRSKIGAVPYAVEAGRASAASGMLATQISALQSSAGRSSMSGSAVTLTQPGRYLVIASAAPVGACGPSWGGCRHRVRMAGVGEAEWRCNPGSTSSISDVVNPPTHVRAGIVTVVAGQPQTLSITSLGMPTGCSSFEIRNPSVVAIPTP